MTPIQQLMLGVGAKKKTYMDDVFSTYLYTGTSANQTVNNGIDLSGEGGMTWLKARNQNYDHWLFDTARGSNKALRSNLNGAEITDTTYMNSFNNNGFTVGSNGSTNYSGVNFSSWSFRKSPGFFDVVSYTGNGSVRTIAHSLGSVPGMIIVKNTSSSGNWNVYHRDTKELTSNAISPGKYTVYLDGNWGASEYANVWNNTSATSSVFTVGTDNATNKNGDTFVAYVFAGGESTAATARSVDFDATGDYLSLASSADFSMGTGDYTIEAWFMATAQNSDTIWTLGDYNNGQQLFFHSNGSIRLYANGWIINSDTNYINLGQWYHSAVVRDSGTVKLYINGELIGSASQSGNMPSNGNGPFYVGAEASPGGGSIGNFWPGKISNLRVVKGTAVYTSSFRPPTEPLTNITNTKLLCCNNSSTTGSTVSPGTITANGDPTASSDSPFDDPAAFTFGESGSESVIKCGSYQGATAAVSVNLGWEPSWVMVKRSNSTGGWRMYDNMRGLTDSGDPFLYANASNAETTTSDDRIKVTSTGFETSPLSVGDSEINNGSSSEFIFLAIRRPDPLVQKPQLATDVFAMDTGSSSSTIPNYDSGFPVDFAWYRKPASTFNWWSGQRLTGDKLMTFTGTNAEGSGGTDIAWDSNTGWSKDSSQGSDYQSWMFKRHAGFDVVTWVGDGESNYTNPRFIPHNLNKIPEMVWIKYRYKSGSTYGGDMWYVYHKGLNGGTNPNDYYISLNNTSAEGSGSIIDAGTTASHLGLRRPGGDGSATNDDTANYLGMLFASVSGISSVGYYDGSSSAQTITTGFQPRFVIIKCTNNASTSWVTLDTTRGWGSGNDNYLMLNSDAAQAGFDFGAPTSTGFSLTGNSVAINAANKKYIYYAHA